MQKELAHMVTPKFSVWLKQPKESKPKRKENMQANQTSKSQKSMKSTARKNASWKSACTESAILKVSNEIDNLRVEW